ncbi:MAG: efflux RND transporter periplasmic adaptor subunit [Acetobacteraceae bacterium]|nr:efflux RND transporter periplasmic adaptor subunit [Acetobacteraceae bacterium]
MLSILVWPLGAPAQAPTRTAVPIRMEERQIRAAGIEVVRVDAESGVPELLLPGTVVVPPAQLRVVAAPAGGLLEALYVPPDQPVRAGEPIARMRSTDLVEAQRFFLEALANDGLAQEKLRRDEQMFRERVIAERRLLTTRAEAAAAAAVLSEREQLLSLYGMGEAQLRQLREDRRISPTLEILAPSSGVVLGWQAQPGERVAQAAPIFTVARLRPLWVNVQVPVARAAAVGQAVRIAIPAHGVEGSLLRLGRSVDPATQSVTAVAEVLEGSENLRPGQAVTVAVGLRLTNATQWRVPASAVVRHRDRQWVFVRTPEGFTAQVVQVLAEGQQSASVAAASLRAGDQVAARGILTLLAELVQAERN